MGDHGKFRLTVIGGMNIDGTDSVGAFLSCDPSALRGIAALFGAEVSIVDAARITALEAQVAAADRLAEAADRAVEYIKGPMDRWQPVVRQLEAETAAFRAAKGE